MSSTEQTVTDLIAYPTELPWLEFKENWFEPHALGEYLSALSNAAALAGRSHGYMVWGVNDATHEIVGTDFTWHRDVKHEPLEHYLARQLSPDLAFAFDEGKVDAKRVVVLSIPAAKGVPVSFDGVRYQRVGSSKVNLAKHPEREAQLFGVLIHGPASIQNTASDDQDLTFGRMLAYSAARGVEFRKETFEHNLGFFTENGKYNLFAQLLSDNNRMPVRVGLFQGTTKASRMYSVREFGNTCLLLSLDKVLEYGDILNVPQADERNRRMFREEVPLFDYEAYREAVINAFVHNQWIYGSAPMVTVYSDRIEILSHGMLPPGQTVEGFFEGRSVPVNKALSDLILQLHISERTGRGVPRIVETYGRECYRFQDNAIVVTIPFHRIDDEFADDEVSNKPGHKVRDKVRDKSSNHYPLLNKTQSNVLEIVRDNPNVTRPQLMEALSLGETSIQNAMAYLRKNGYIERVGSRKTGWWRVLK